MRMGLGPTTAYESATRVWPCFFVCFFGHFLVLFFGLRPFFGFIFWFLAFFWFLNSCFFGIFGGLFFGPIHSVIHHTTQPIRNDWAARGTSLPPSRSPQSERATSKASPTCSSGDAREMEVDVPLDRNRCAATETEPNKQLYTLFDCVMQFCEGSLSNFKPMARSTVTVSTFRAWSMRRRSL